MEYTRLAADQKRKMLEQRAANLEVEHFQNALTLTTQQAALPSMPPEQMEAANAEISRLTANLAVIDAAHAAVTAELEKMGGE